MELAIPLIVIVLLANLYASVVVVRAPILSRTQRFLQLTLIWLIPLVGAVLCALMARTHSTITNSASSIDAVYLDSDPTAFSDTSDGGGGGD